MSSQLKAMLEAKSVAVVGASARPGSFGQRVLLEIERSPSRPEIYLVNPRYSGGGLDGRECLASLGDLPEPVDLVLMGVGDQAIEQQISLAAARGDRSAVIFGNVADPPGLRARVAAIAREGGMAVCGGGCMGFVNVAAGLRAIGYLELDPLPPGPIALVTHSGSAFSALLRADRRLGWTLAVSAGQELVTTTAEYLDYALSIPETKVIGLLLESVRGAAHLRTSLLEAAARGVPVVLLTVGGSPGGRAFVSAHSGALAGDDAGWEALVEATGVIRVRGLDELVDCLELFSAGRRVTRAGLGLGTVHDSGAERTMMADVSSEVGVPFPAFSRETSGRLAQLLDPGLEVANPLDVWGRGADTRELFTGALSTVASDPAVGAVVLCVDLVPEFDGDESYREAALDFARSATTPFAVLSNLPSALDRKGALRLRSAGVPVLEGTRSGLVALKALLDEPERLARALEGGAGGAARAEPAEPTRAARWSKRLRAGAALGTAESFRLLADYGIPVVDVVEASSRNQAVVAGRDLGFPCVLKIDDPAFPHKSDVGGVVVATDEEALASAYDEIAGRLGPRVTVSAMAPQGLELALGIVRDPLFGPLVVVGAGGVLVELVADRSVGLPPLSRPRALRLVDGLRIRPMLDGFRGGAEVDVEAVVDAVLGLSELAVELSDVVEALDVNPLRCSEAGVAALDVLVETCLP